MNEVKKVHLGRQPFTIAVDAHKALRDYLTAIEKQPGVQPEVVKEVEMRMAELLAERGISGEKVILPDDVDFLKQQLGEPRDFTDDTAAAGDKAESDTHEESVEEPQSRRLYRDPQQGILAGVASGLAAYTGIDVLIIRIIFIGLTFASGAGILIYILIWLLAPEAKTPSDRLRMQGKAVTVDSLKEMVDRADLAGASQRAGRNVGSFLGSFLEGLIRIIALIMGAFFVAIGVIVSLFAVAAGVYLLIHGLQAGGEIVFPVGAQEVWLVIMGAIAMALLGFFCLMFGLIMTGKKWRLPGWLTAVLVGAMLVLTGVSVALAMDASSAVQKRYQSQRQSQRVEVPAFTKLSLSGQDTTFIFKPDTVHYLELSYVGNNDSMLLKKVVENGALTVNTDDFIDQAQCSGLCLNNYQALKVVIHAPSLEEVSLAGHGNDFQINDRLNQSAMTLNIRRYEENTMTLQHIEAAKAIFDERGSRDWSLRLEGLRPPSGSREFITAINHESYPMAHLGNVEAVQLRLINGCEDDEPYIGLSDVTRSIQLGDDPQMMLRSAEELRQRQDNKDSNLYNCVNWF